MSQTPADPADDPRVIRLAREYLAELESGRSPDRRAFEKRYPELSGAVAECLDGVELAHAAGVALRPAEPAPAPPEPTAEPLGDFRIVREIGRGGMGIVYEAVQLSLGRRVALKVLPFAAGLDAKQLQRFKTEAYAAAQLHHTNIVPVYAVGSERGTHYYAMQLIEGRPLDDLIRELRGDPNDHTGNTTVDFRLRSTAPAGPEPNVTRTVTATSRTREGYRTAARIGLQVAEALEYAHEAGVIHRDIKPANLLLDPRGTVWVTDFGLAQVNAEANVTRTGDVFGTLRYMSPEQASGQRVLVDHRTDVYSLGATLYELLTLQPIFPGTDRQSLLYQILHDDPKPLRAHDRYIPIELETIVLKATAKLPHERYATAGELAEDLRRFLDDRPILARRPTPIDHVRKWLRRHPAYVGAGVVLLVLGVIGFAISTALVTREKGRTVEAYEREKQRAKEALQQFDLARKAVDEMILVANTELKNDPVQENLRRKLLESALTYYQQFIELRKDDPKAQQDLELTRTQVKELLSDLAVLQGAWRQELLREPGVQTDLRLTLAQRQEVNDLFERFGRLRGQLFREFARMTPDERSQKMVEHLKEIDAAVSEMLTATQLNRLAQIAVQSRGPQAFRDADVIAALALTAEQQAKLKQIEQEAFAGRFVMGRVYIPGMGGPGGPDARGGGRGGPGGPDARGGGRGGRGGPEGGRGPDGGGRGGGDPDHEFERKAVMEKMLAVLTPVQRQKWDELIGEPFKGPLPFRGPFRR